MTIQHRLGSALPIVLLASCSFVLASKVMVAQAAVSTGLHPLQLAVLGNAGAAFLLLGVARGTGQIISWERRHLILYLVLGLFGAAIPTYVTFLIVNPVGPAYVSSLYALSPLLTMAFAAAVGLEGLTFRRTIGILIGFSGMVALIGQKIASIDLSATFWVLLGLTVPFAAAFGNVIRTIFWPEGASPLSFVTATLIVSSALLAVVAPFFGYSETWEIDGEGQFLWLSILIGITAFSHLLNFSFQRISGPVIFSQIGYWGTGFGVMLAAILFEDVLGPTALAGIAAIIVGGLITNHRVGSHSAAASR